METSEQRADEETAEAESAPLENAEAAAQPEKEAAPAVLTTIEKEQPQETAPAFDTSTLTEGTAVLHAKFGEGRIVKIDKLGKYIHVAFSVGEKTFTNSAFETGFLKLKI